MQNGIFITNARQMMRIAQPRAALFLVALLLLSVFLPPPPAHAVDLANQQWNLTADRVSTNHAAGISQAWGNAVLRSGENFLSADFIEYHRDTGWIYLKGNVHTFWNDYDIYADQAEFDLVNKTGTIKNGTIFIEQSAVVVEGKEIHRTPMESYTFGEATLTACEGPAPDWSIQVSSGEIRLGDYADVHDPKIRIRDVPVLYAPFMRVPLQAKRQSGLLAPAWGSSSRLGGFVSQSFFWAIDKERDMTATATYFGKRGVMGGLEYRHATDAETLGLWRLDYINDRVVVKTAAEQESQFRSQNLARTNANRYWLRSKYNGWVFDPSIKAKLDIDYASDSTFLRTYDILHSSYSRSYNDFVNQFGRDIETIDSLTRTSTGLLSRAWDAEYAVNLKAQYTEDLRYKGGNTPGSRDPTVQLLPELSAYAYKQQFFGSPFEIEADSSLSYFDRRYGVSGGRFDAHPRLSLPLSSPYGSVIPSVGWRQTFYSVTNFQANPEGRSNERTQERGMYDVRVTAFSEVFGVYDLGMGEIYRNPAAEYAGSSTWTALKHSIQPRLDYIRVQNKDQTARPDFDQFDRIQPNNELRYSFINVLNRKRGQIVAGLTEDGEPDPYLAFDYRDFIRHRLEQGYDFEEAKRGTHLDIYPRRPFSDVLSQLELSPLSWLSLTNKVFISPYGEGITQIQNSIGVSDPEYGSMRVGLTQYSKIDEYKRQNRDAINMLTLNGRLHLPYSLTLDASYQRDLRQDTTVNAALGLTWHAQCYDVSAVYKQDQYDRSVSLWVSILGFNTPSIGFTERVSP